MLTFGSLFSGIGGFDLGFERAGMVCKWQVEIDDYCTKVLQKHWPNVPKFRDVRICGGHNLEPIDVVCGGFPCQPFSGAGKQRGADDDRNLWPEMFRVVQELTPSWVVGENVSNIINLYLDDILSDLEGAGYEAWTLSIPACAFGAPHIRQRIFVVAYSSVARSRRLSVDADRGSQGMANAHRIRRAAAPQRENDAEAQGYWPNDLAGYAGQDARSIPYSNREGLSQSERKWKLSGPSQWATEPDVGRVAHGIPDRVDRLRALGNALTPQQAEWIGRLIVSAESRVS
jgi:DNA (cytosine-5)-methyltransferase 1